MYAKASNVVYIEAMCNVERQNLGRNLLNKELVFLILCLSNNSFSYLHSKTGSF
jgi:hypothetical protein